MSEKFQDTSPLVYFLNVLSLLGIISLILFSITKATSSFPKPVELDLISSFFSPFQCDGLVTRDVDLDLKVKCVGVKSHLVLR